MKHRFVLLRTSVIEVECPCTKCEGLKKIEVKKGTVLTITPDRKYVDNLGWYVLIDFDDKFQVYINIHDFEKYYFENMFCSFIDLDLKLNYLEYKLNESLDERNEEAFHILSSELMDMNELREKIIRSMSIHYEV
ncbi:hypothetical protein [Fredinandcohnia sp. FSL W7-1320]|uniref:hypothetical protein n=1 Tax=Fredinandcohnia sp. FSL W7-1320 TaxID=2954540 RepID=UPI0030FD74D3